ncbi:hypothetical protein RhiirA4_476800 [Rhizophagus irregularis]|uniref:Uncharacterized protein n=1 Tax=Rhizophagus irregularis TaxID=588596 RepID=A0A2I1HC61_9GLOM|nr:hypothetical protein RhiirA4_476800 [Rhizophagus irregularis]
MFECLEEVVENYNILGNGKAAGKICYIDAFALFELLNTSIILLYTSYAADVLPLELFITSNELEITLEKAHWSE